VAVTTGARLGLYTYITLIVTLTPTLTLTLNLTLTINLTQTHTPILNRGSVQICQSPSNWHIDVVRKLISPTHKSAVFTTCRRHCYDFEISKTTLTLRRQPNITIWQFRFISITKNLETWCYHDKCKCCNIRFGQGLAVLKYLHRIWRIIPVRRNNVVSW